MTQTDSTQAERPSLYAQACELIDKSASLWQHRDEVLELVMDLDTSPRSDHGHDGPEVGQESPAVPDVYPVTWMDEDDIERNAWSRNPLTNEIEPDPNGDPLYTTVAPTDA